MTVRWQKCCLSLKLWSVIIARKYWLSNGYFAQVYGLFGILSSPDFFAVTLFILMRSQIDKVNAV